MRLLKLAVPILLLMLGATTLVTLAQSDSDVVTSFKGYVADYVEGYKTDRREQIVQSGDAMGQPVPGEWHKESFDAPQSVNIDVQKTNSLVSPYIGVLEFSLTEHNTAIHKSKDDAENDSNFIQVLVFQHRHTYAFQDGVWVPSHARITFRC
jgi:hypothetical protein